MNKLYHSQVTHMWAEQYRRNIYGLNNFICLNPRFIQRGRYFQEHLAIFYTEEAGQPRIEKVTDIKWGTFEQTKNKNTYLQTLPLLKLNIFIQ